MAWRMAGISLTRSDPDFWWAGFQILLRRCISVVKRIQDFPMSEIPHPLLTFRPLERADFRLLQKWLSAPHVAAWWHTSLDMEQMEGMFGPRIDGREPTHVFMIEHNGPPIGWIQWYRWSDYPEHARQLDADPRAAGIDLAIGEAALTGLGLGSAAIREFLRQIVFAEPDVIAVITDPEVGNVRSLRAFARVGFRTVKTVQLAGENCKRHVERLEQADCGSTSPTIFA
jgi:aminoglycoside 6'-N-acetyltransferase